MMPLASVKAFIILDLNGTQLLSKYYDTELENLNKNFERQVFIKTKNRKSRDDLFVAEDSLVVHRLMSQYHFYVVGKKDENPMVLDKTLNCLVEVVGTLTEDKANSGTISSYLGQLILALDEMCEHGLLLESDPDLVLNRVSAQLQSGSEQSLVEAIQNVTDLRFSWLRS